MKIISDFVTNSSEADYYDCDCDDCRDCRNYNCDCDCRDCDCDYDDGIDWDIVNDFYDGDLGEYYNVD